MEWQRRSEVQCFTKGTLCVSVRMQPQQEPHSCSTPVQMILGSLKGLV